MHHKSLNDILYPCFPRKVGNSCSGGSNSPHFTNLSLMIDPSVYSAKRNDTEHKGAASKQRRRRSEISAVKMERSVFHTLVVFLLMPLSSRLQETEPQRSSQDLCGEMKQLRELVYQQAVTLSEIKVKMVYIEKEKAGETCVTLPSITLAVCTISAFSRLRSQRAVLSFMWLQSKKTSDVDVKIKTR